MAVVGRHTMTEAGRCADALWARWARILGPAPQWDPARTSTLVVVPHPDDEVLASGGLICRQRDRGVDVRVVAVTDGENAYGGAVDAIELAAVRSSEQRDALGILGVDASTTSRLEFPDGSVARHEAQLIEDIIRLCHGCGQVVAPWIDDHHCDHEACGRAATTAAVALGVPVVYSMFWTWHHVAPERLAAEHVAGMPLEQSEARRRREALARHRSQLTDVVADEPMLSSADVEPLRWTTEYYIVPRR